MSNFKYALVSLVVLISSAGCFATSQAGESWWITLKLKPENNSLQGLPVSRFNANWTYASFIGNDDIKKKIGDKDYQTFIKPSFSFSRDPDLNNNGVDESFHVGVYKDNSNAEGVFLAIFEQGKLVKVLTDGTHQNFSALLINEKQLFWYRCMECGTYEQLVWSGSSYFLE